MAKRKKHPKITPVIVHWVDSMATSGWDAKPGAKSEITSAGVLVKRGKGRIAIAQSRSHYSHGELLEIPLSAVRRVRKLK